MLKIFVSYGALVVLGLYTPLKSLPLSIYQPNVYKLFFLLEDVSEKGMHEYSIIITILQR